MSRFIIHHEGAYNIWCTVSDAAVYVSALTRDQLHETGEPITDERLARAHATGSSGLGDSLDDCIAVNRCGPKEANLSREEFIARFLTLPEGADHAR